MPLAIPPIAITPFRDSPLAGFRVYTCGDMEKRQSPHRAFGFVFKANVPSGHAHHHLVSRSRLASGRLRIRSFFNRSLDLAGLLVTPRRLFFQGAQHDFHPVARSPGLSSTAVENLPSGSSPVSIS